MFKACARLDIENRLFSKLQLNVKKQSKYSQLVLSTQNLAQVLTKANEYSRKLTSTHECSRLRLYLDQHPLVRIIQF